MIYDCEFMNKLVSVHKVIGLKTKLINFKEQILLSLQATINKNN